MKKLLAFASIVCSLSIPSLPCFSQTSGFKTIKKIAAKGDGKWDFITYDSVKKRLFVSHGTSVQVIDIEKETVIGEVQNTPGVHGIAVVNEVNKGFTSNGKDSTVTVFDLSTFTTLKTIKLNGKNPDHIIYDSFSKRVFAFNNKSANMSVIDPKGENVLATIDLGGMPELAVSNDKGKIFVNLEDKSEVVEFDALSYKITSRWSLKPGEEPTGIALDKENKRLFIGCANKLLVVLDAKNGKLITTLPIGEKVDGVAFDPELKLIFTSNGEGTVTVIQQETMNTYKVLENVPTKKGAKTLAYDQDKHRLYLPSADYGTPEAASAENPNPKAPIAPGTFGVLVVGK
jgi:YVTN family beta-propeller protein